MLRLFAAACAALMLNACATTERRSETEQLIAEAAKTNDGVPADITFEIRGADAGTGLDAGDWFINSQPDYRDWRSLNVVLTPAVVPDFVSKYEVDHPNSLIGKRAHVSGTAERVKINMYARGELQEDLYYYQTQILVSDLDQIEILPAE